MATKESFFFGPGSAATMWYIVASLADSICRHPDVTLESGLVQNTNVHLYLHNKQKATVIRIGNNLFIKLTNK